MPLSGSRIYFFVLAFLFLVPVTSPYLAGHDTQRMAQCFIALLCVWMLIAHSAKQSFVVFLSSTERRLCLLILTVGLLSTFLARQPMWAFTEVAVLLACCAITVAFAVERRVFGVAFDHPLLLIIALLCLIKTSQFLAGTAAALSAGMPTINTDLLLDGFSNKRFYGQFQTFTLPLLALPLLLTNTRRSLKVAAFCLLACWWMIAISGGTRGTWLGMGVAGGIIACCGRYARAWVVWQLGAMLSGLLLYCGLFIFLTGYLGMTVENFAGDRLTSTLSAREVIWWQAWDMIKQRPLLGFGPMHFADIYNKVAAHPHQSVLQWASEWGIPSALCVGWLASRGLLATLRVVRHNAQSHQPVDLLRICLFASLIGALAQSMVDGVIVMPYSQLWLCIVVGWLLAIHERRDAPQPMSPVLGRLWLASMAASVIFLGYVVVRDVPRLADNQAQFQRDFGGILSPRFWSQGVIANKP